MSGPLVERGGTVVVGTSLDRASAIALQRAVALAQTFDASLRVVHAISWDRGPLRVDGQELAGLVVQWAMTAAKIVLDRASVSCVLDEPARALARTAVATGASLMVIGASRPRLAPGVADLVSRMAATRLLVAQAPRHRREVVAATDLCDDDFVVARAAACWAEAFSADVTLLHNVEAGSEEPCFAARRLAPALRRLLSVARSLRPVRRARLCHAVSTHAAISSLVRVSGADLVVVGTRPSRGRTAMELRWSTSSSVLVVPLRDRC